MTDDAAKVIGSGGTRQGWAGPQHEDWAKQAAQQQGTEDLQDTAASTLSQNTTANAEEGQQFYPLDVSATQPQVKCNAWHDERETDIIRVILTQHAHCIAKLHCLVEPQVAESKDGFRLKP